MASMFHKFIEVSASKPHQALTIVEFPFMEQQIRKSYKQLKSTKGVQKPNDDFIDYWKEIGSNLGRQQQVAFYFRWIQLLQRSLKNYTHRQLPQKQVELYMKKSMISKWQVRKVQVNGLVLQIFSKKLKEYPLKCFCIRKSKNKDHFSWVMQVVMQLDDSKFKSFHLGTNNINTYNEWYLQLQSRIDLARIDHFKQVISSENKLKLIEGKKKRKGKGDKIGLQPQKSKQKTITEMVIDKNLREIEHCDGLTIIEDEETQYQKSLTQVHPNIFSKLFPQRNLDDFCETPLNGVLLQCQKQYRLYEIDGLVKIFISFSRNIDVVFRAISQSHKNWNPQINTFNIKNKISSQNSCFIYQKDKPKGLLYRERDYFYLRHCFNQSLQSKGNLVQSKKEKMFMIEKSIDSIHNPPFMTVARGEKQLIWCAVGNPQQKQSMLIIQGMIKGGGYINANQDKESTIRYFKKLLQLDNYLQQIQLAKHQKDGYLFNNNWTVNFKQQQQIQMKEEEEKEEQQQQGDQFYSPREIQSQEFQHNRPQQLDMTKKQEQNNQSAYFSPQKSQAQFNQFMQQTSKNMQKTDLIQQSPPMSQSMISEFNPPQFNQDKSVLIPQDYLKRKHRLQALAKGKSYYVQQFRGHHLWKGEWAVSEAGGLNYVDKQKMRQQRGVLTFIIRRIGKNILSGKGILNISLPVDIFCRQSNIQRLAMSFSYFPIFLQKVIQSDPIDQLKGIISSVMGSSLIYLTMDKPFNPILGQTYQGWIDGCPVYFQQISHHPPIASYLMKGRGYDVYGTMQAKMDISINSGTGINEGIFTIKFQSGRTFHFTTPPGQLSGLTYGQRKLAFVDRTYFWSMEQGIFVQIIYNPLSKQSRFFGGSRNYVGQQRLADYFQGTVKKYKPQDLKQHLTPKKGSNRVDMAIPRSSPPQQPLAQYSKIHGRWSKYIFYGQQTIFNVDKDIYFKYNDEKYPLPSHSNFREDIVYRRMNQFVLSQEWKQVLQVRQRKDRKLRETTAKRKK